MIPPVSSDAVQKNHVLEVHEGVVNSLPHFCTKVKVVSGQKVKLKV